MNLTAERTYTTAAVTVAATEISHLLATGQIDAAHTVHSTIRALFTTNGRPTGQFYGGSADAARVAWLAVEIGQATRARRHAA